MARVTWTGLDELMTALKNLPEHLAEEATTIVASAAQDVEATTEAAYVGSLQRGVKITEKAIGRYGVAYQVRSMSWLAWIYENGSVARHTVNGVSRGAMPPKHVLIPAAERRRPQMYRELKDMLVREGLVVSGDAP
jgi:hypothetical protein